MLQKYLHNEIIQIDELEAEYLPYAYWDADSARQLDYNLWQNIVSPSVIG
jgi:hypothetical protein